MNLISVTRYLITAVGIIGVFAFVFPMPGNADSFKPGEQLSGALFSLLLICAGFILGWVDDSLDGW